MPSLRETGEESYEAAGVNGLEEWPEWVTDVVAQRHGTRAGAAGRRRRQGAGGGRAPAAGTTTVPHCTVPRAAALRGRCVEQQCAPRF
eukprot:gene5587-biopygen8329